MARAVWIDCPLELALKRNADRLGSKEYVPPYVVRRYHKNFEVPTIEEGFESVDCWNRLKDPLTGP